MILKRVCSQQKPGEKHGNYIYMYTHTHTHTHTHIIDLNIMLVAGVQQCHSIFLYITK